MSGSRHTTYADIEQELGDAEELLRNIRKRRQALSLATILLSVVAIIALAAATTLVRGEDEALPLAIGVAAGSVATLSVSLVIITRRRRWVGRQEWQMVKAVDWVREVFPLVAAQEQWSAAQAEAIRKRVAHFPIVARQGRRKC